MSLSNEEKSLITKMQLYPLLILVKKLFLTAESVLKTAQIHLAPHLFDVTFQL